MSYSWWLLSWFSGELFRAKIHSNKTFKIKSISKWRYFLFCGKIIYKAYNVHIITMVKFIKDNILYIAWITAVISMAGSLYFSEVLGFAPCVLCWYQRIAMYPLVLIIGMGIIKKDRSFYDYAIPLSIIGGVIAFYQNLLYYSVISISLVPCVSGVSCSARYIQMLGFIDIPLLSLASFAVITAALITHKKLT